MPDGQLPSLQTPRLHMRPWRPSDREPFAALNADPVVMEHFPALLTRAQSDAFADRIEAHFVEHGYGLWAIESEDAPFIGFVGLAVPGFEAAFTPCVEVGWRLARAHWHRGHATEAAQAAIAHGFEDVGLDEIVSFTVVRNHPSRRVMEKLGMHHAGEFDHPTLPSGHALERHVLYRLDADAWRTRTLRNQGATSSTE
ncbi:MAG: GNAT family N-acetyltransferase [Myxococcales bacterium]|nr:GNAT family N-acetyltransferase [Myxococcales bacterium]